MSASSNQGSLKKAGFPGPTSSIPKSRHLSFMDPSQDKDSASGSPREFSEASSPAQSPASTPLPQPESPNALGFPFHGTQSLHQRRSGAPLSRPESSSSITPHSRQSSEGIVFTTRVRSFGGLIPGSPLNPSRAAWASRDSAFAPPPLRDPSVYSESVIKAPTKAVPFKSTALQRDEDGNTNVPKPWLEKKDPYIRISYWTTYATMLLGVIASGALIYLGFATNPKLPNMCLVLEDNFDTFDTSVWTREVDLGGYGNGHFDMTTDSEANSYVKDGKLYITPTLTADVIGRDNVLNGHTFNLTSCTNLIDDGSGNKVPNPDACGRVSNSTTGQIIPPIMSARLNTKGRAAVQYGRVSVVAKLPRGDWLWPAIWMLPVNDTYGPWPMSGEIDIMESRGNDPEYPKQGRNYVRSTLNWGPTVELNAGHKTYGWWYERRTSFDQGFHEFTVEWTDSFMYMWVDTRLHRAVDLRFNKPFFERGGFPQVITNGTEQIVLQNPWLGRGNSAPFDHQFYLILNVAVGGTNGWFPDGYGNKPWLDGSQTAARDFYNKESEWLPTWGSPEDRSLIVDSVKMWQQC